VSGIGQRMTDAPRMPSFGTSIEVGRFTFFK
jgi:hypothetical protein